MNSTTFYIKILLSLVVFVSCNDKNTINPKLNNNAVHTTYLNHHDSVSYVGTDKCITCHAGNHSTYKHTGMGMSLGDANKEKSNAIFTNHSVLYDSLNNLNYKPFWQDSVLYLKEFRLVDGDTVYNRNQRINYIIGSGQHTNSHLVNSNGYITQAPFTYYTQDGHLDFPPGFENGNNTRFSRKIGLECMSCHNGYPDFVLGSENKYRSIPKGIDCERCHGPGEKHIQKIQKGEITDITKEIDYSIVNPAKLSRDLQFDLCSRCHLQGNMVLKNGKSFYDFKPGMELSSVMDVFLPKYTNSDSRFIMASHVDRLKQSECFTKTDNLSCITCHNPHVSVKNTDNKHFNSACINCHSSKNEQSFCKEDKAKIKDKTCFSCHMPKSGSVDIPHVRITDHKIQITNEETRKETKNGDFLSLVAINNLNPDTTTLVKAYLQQYERFEALHVLLDKAKLLLDKIGVNKESLAYHIHYYYLKQDYRSIVKLTRNLNKTWFKDYKIRLDNHYAWTFIRIATAYDKLNLYLEADNYYKAGIKLAPYSLDFKNNYSEFLLKFAQKNQDINLLNSAQLQHEEIIKMNPLFEDVYLNYGYILSLKKEFKKSIVVYKKGIEIEPTNQQLYTNLIGVYVQNNQLNEAKSLVTKSRLIFPKNNLLLEMEKQLNSM